MQPDTIKLSPALIAFAPSLVIFDKDGTLIDFHAMWGRWMLELTRRLEVETGRAVSGRIFKEVGFNPSSCHIAQDGHLAVTPTTDLRRVIVQVLESAGLSPLVAKTAVTAVWALPDVRVLTHPLTDLAALFHALHACGSKVAISTSDDRVTTEAMITGLKLAHLVDGVCCADDGRPLKPEPDMVLVICEKLGIPPDRTVMVGDNTVDLQMGRAAGVGLNIGVLSGLGVEAELSPYADIILSSIRELVSGD